jgi:hypothetical protein
MMMDRNRLIVAVLIGLGLLFLAAGAIFVDLGRTTYTGPPNADLDTAYANYRNVLGPALAHFGILLFVGGLFWAAVFLEMADPFVRLFLLILGFVALLLVLSGSNSIFGLP